MGSNGEEVFYKTLEIATFWGQLSRTSKTHKLTLAVIIVVSVSLLLLFVRCSARQGYVKV